MSTTRGIAFALFFAALLLLGAAPCDAAPPGGRVRAPGEASLPNRDTGDESGSNVKMSRRSTENESGAVVACPACPDPAKGPPTAVRLPPIAPRTHLPSPGTCADEERRVVVVPGGTGPPGWGWVQFTGSRLHGKNRAGPGICTCSGGGVSAGATVKVGTASVPAPPSPLSQPGGGRLPVVPRMDAASSSLGGP